MERLGRFGSVVVVFFSLTLGACSRDDSSIGQSGSQSSGQSSGQSSALPAIGAAAGQKASQKPSASRTYDAVQVSRGGKIFQDNCIECHGSAAEGDPNWRKRNQQGRYPPPPLNGTGHAWHHPYKMLAQTIKNGSPGGQGDMPAWGDRLTDQQIDDVMVWFISKWPDQLYDAWYRVDKNSRKSS